MPTKKAKKAKTPVKAIPYVLKDSYIQVTVEGKPFNLDSTHPTFNRMKKALQSKNWKAVPKLVTLAQNLLSASHGNVEVKNGVVLYKGTAIHDALTRRIVDMVKGKKAVQFLLLFIDDLYKNPSPKARKEFGDWLLNNDLPITDDGGFIAYKSVDEKLKDKHTGTIDNSPGQVILGSRKWFNTNYRTQCESGYHICSKQYGLYGSRVMAVKAFPRDVLSAEGGKMRVVNYEVLYELGKLEKSQELHFKEEGFKQLEKQLVVEIKAERKELLKMILDSPKIKRLIRNEKLSKSTIQKAAYARLKTIAQRYEVVPKPQTVATENLPPLEQARKAAGLTVGQIAKQMHLSYKDVAKLEKGDPAFASEARTASFLAALADLVGLPNLSRSAITYPIAVKKVA